MTLIMKVTGRKCAEKSRPRRVYVHNTLSPSLPSPAAPTLLHTPRPTPPPPKKKKKKKGGGGGGGLG